jgi:hypothetical protein
MSFQTLRDLPATDLQVGDWPVSLAGYRPIEAIKVMPRAKRVIVTIPGLTGKNVYDGTITLPAGHIVGRVRRPVMAAMQFVRTFDPSEAANA